jgi:hypothetical protein
MSWFSSACKPENLKKYGGVEKMYIHFYTFSYIRQNEVKLFWYTSDTENLDLFLDFKYIFTTLKKYGAFSAFTGDIFTIKSLHKFREQLILLGIVKDYVTNVNMIDGTTKELHISQTTNITDFNDLFDICFEDYEFINSFSSENELSKKRIEVEIEPTAEPADNNHSLIRFEFLSENYIIPYHSFSLYPTEVIKSRISNATLNNWFNTMIKKEKTHGYCNAVATLLSLIKYNTEDPDTSNDGDGDTFADDDNTTVVTTSGTDNKIHPVEWVKLFCDLYLEETKGTDILLSDIYQSYITASGWTNTPTMSMASFIKRLRALNRFTIKRRSKGMMAIGWTCIVSSQGEFFDGVRKGQFYNRQLLHYTPIIELYPLIPTDKGVLEMYNQKYAREALILLKQSSVPINYQTVAQFCAIPQIASQLPVYKEYIDYIIKSYQEMCSQLNGSRGKDKETGYSQRVLQEYRDFTTRCTLYFPFSSRLYDSARTSLNFKRAEQSDGVGFAAFNESFGMFATSKQYHLFQPELGTPQSYDNAVGASIENDFKDANLVIQPGERFYNFNQGTKFVPNVQLRTDPEDSGIEITKHEVTADSDDKYFLKPGALIGLNTGGTLKTNKVMTANEVKALLNELSLTPGTKLNGNSST